MGKNGILRTLRLEKRFSREELSDIFNKEFSLDTNKEMISEWETGIKTPAGVYLLAYTKLFNISLNYISTLIDTSNTDEEDNIIEKTENTQEINIVKRLREELGISQEELAEKTGYKSKKKIEMIEAGEEGIPVSKISKFVKALKTTKDILLKDNDKSKEKISKQNKGKPDIILESGQELYFDIINSSKIVLHYFDELDNNEKKIIELKDTEINEFNKSINIVNILFDSPYVTKSDKFSLKREALKCYVKAVLKNSL